MDPELTAPTAGDVDAAAAALRGRVARPALLPAPSLAGRLGAPAWIKPELFQPGGSFKIRGALHRIGALTAEERACGVTTVSAGNHGQAVALACRTAGIPATVFLPSGASAVKAAATRAHGATVDQEAADVDEAFARMHAFVARTGAFVLHPFDDPAVIAGQGTVGREIVQDCPDVELVVVPAGGGGLVSGIALAVKAHRPAARVVAVEPAHAPTLSAGLRAGAPVAPARRPTAADALAPPTAGRLAVAICSALVDDVVLLSEDELLEGLRFAYREIKLACEPGGAAAIAAVLTGRVGTAAGPAVVVASGGNVDPAVLAGALCAAPAGPGQAGAA